MNKATTKPKRARNGVGSGEFVGRRAALAVQMLRAYEDRVDFWLKEVEKYPRATHGRREAQAYANAFCCMVDDLRLLWPHRKTVSSRPTPILSRAANEHENHH